MDHYFMLQMMKYNLDICVCNPVTDNYTTFEILIQTCNPAFTLRQSRTRRRYKDFCWLRKTLKKHHPLCACAELPEKKKFAERFDIQFLVQRMKELEDWLQRIVATSLYLSDTTLHLFLQTGLTCRQIELYIVGNMSESDLLQGYRDAHLCLDSITELKDMKRVNSGNSGSQPSCVSTSAGQSSPVRIQNQPPVVLHDMQVCSDSGIAGLDTDVEFSYDSLDSSYISSMESTTMPDKYPPITEACPTEFDSASNKYTAVSRACSVKQTMYIIGENCEIKTEHVDISDADQTDIQRTDTSIEKLHTANEHVSKHPKNNIAKDSMLENTSEQIDTDSTSGLSDQSVKHVSESLESVNDNGAVAGGKRSAVSKPVIHKVEMGVTFSVN